MTTSAERTVFLLYTDEEKRAPFLRAQLSMIMPGASIQRLSREDLTEGALSVGDAAVIDITCGALADSGGAEKARERNAGVVKDAMKPAALLRARGFTGPVIVIASVPDESALYAAAEALGIIALARERSEESPSALATALSSAFEADARVTPALMRARRVFAAGQAALSLQHAISNPLAALMAEAQLLQMEELNGEQRGSVDRMVDLCRRLSVLVRQLDALAEG